MLTAYEELSSEADNAEQDAEEATRMSADPDCEHGNLVAYTEDGQRYQGCQDCGEFWPMPLETTNADFSDGTTVADREPFLAALRATATAAPPRKWTSEAGPRQTKLVNQAMNTLAQEHRSFCELTGIKGVDESSFNYYSPYGGGNREDVSAVQAAIAEQFDYTVTAKNHKEIIAAIQAALPALKQNRPTKDSRRSPEEDAERKQGYADKESERRAKEQAKSLQVDASVRELRLKCPWAKPEAAGLSSYARAAANLRAELGIAFPGVKFSVTSKSFSMGDSVRYEWTLGPTGKEVEDIADKYAYGRFDSMQDLSTSDNSVFGEAVGIVLGRSKYVNGSRNLPDYIREQVGRLLCEAQKIEFQGDLTAHVFGEGDYDKHLRDHVYELLARTSFPVGSEITGLEYRESGYNEMTGQDDEGGYYLTFSENAAPPVAVIDSGSLNENLGVTIIENTGKGGIEIRFASKPAQSTLDAIHGQGHGVWRWHKRGKFWYAKANDNTRAFAQSLKGGE